MNDRSPDDLDSPWHTSAGELEGALIDLIDGERARLVRLLDRGDPAVPPEHLTQQLRRLADLRGRWTGWATARP